MASSSKSKDAAIWLLLILVLGVGGAVIYTQFDPTRYVWMPQCPLRLLTGWNCPGCGIQRALHAMLHGHFAEAFSYNYFFMFSIPYAVLLVIATILKYFERGERFVRAVEHPLLARTYIVLFFVWGVTRNILGI
ncbi:MAG: DUF2752 domain-containing protein [Bacteroidaceae bacterium]|nr:DUF2752 domain-containing protein [Bacteroidaceae bacterium]